MASILYRGILSTSVLACLIVPRSFAADVAVETVLSGLTNPCGVAVRPGDSAERYEIFVADSGAGRIICTSSDESNSAVDVVTGFPLATLGDGGLPVGPMALHFLDRDHLVVGCSGSDGASVRLFELGDLSAPVTADAAKQQLALPMNDKTRQHVYAIARTRPNASVEDAIIFSTFANDQTGELRAMKVRADVLAAIRPFGAAENSEQAGSPVAIAVDAGGHVVVGWAGRVEQPRDSRLTFYRPTDGRQRMARDTNLFDILGLAFSPKTGNLYAVDHAALDTRAGGLFRIDDASEPGEPKCVATKIVELLRPSALAFGPDGGLYVTAFGDVNAAAPQGSLLRITGEL